MNNDFDYGIYYRAFHDDSDAHAQHMVQWALDQVEPHLLPSAAGPVLDIGCGMGFALQALEHRGYTDVQGVDRDRSQVDACLAKGLKVQRSEDLLGWLDAREGQFAQIMMLDVLEHIPVEQQIAVARGIHKALKPGGRALIRVPNANSILASRWKYIDYTHTSSFTEHSVRFVLLNAGFKTCMVPPDGQPGPRPKLRRGSWGWAFRQDLARWLLRHFWRRVLELELNLDGSKLPLGLNLVAVADK